MFPEITRDDVFRLETRRLWLRWPAIGDAAALAAIAGQQAVAEMTINVPHPYPKGEASRQIEHWRETNVAGDGLTLILTGTGEDRMPLGVAGIEPIESAPGFAPPAPDAAKIGLLLSPDRWGTGLATEAVQALLDVAFVLTPLTRIESAIRVVNPAARRLVERCGFAYEGTVLRDASARGGMVPCDCFRLDRKTWASLKQWRQPRGMAPFNPASRPASLPRARGPCTDP